MDAREPPSLTPSPASTGRAAGFLRSVLVLVSGTALAHGITAAAMPILSRLYSPADFGVLAVFAGCLAILSVIACLRLELAIALPASQSEANEILLVALMCCFAISSLTAIPILLAPNAVAKALGQPALEAYLWILPLGVLLAGSYSALQFWHVRQKNFGLLASTRAMQSAAAASVQLAAGATGAGPIGLLAGQALNAGVACLALARALRRANEWPKLSRLKALISSYRRFPLVSAPEALANAASLQLPLIIIAAVATPTEAGYLTMAIFVIQAPMSLIGSAIGQVYLSQAPDALRTGQLAKRTSEVLGGLWQAGIGPLIFIGALAPILFEPIFGDGWERAGWLVTWMTPWFIAQFLSVPISMALHVTGHQARALWLQIFGLLFRNGLVLLAAAHEPSSVGEAYAVSGAIFYAIYLFVITQTIGLDRSAFIEQARRGSKSLAVWCTLAGASAFILRDFIL